MKTTELAQSIETSRAKRLKAATNETHERLDQSIMAGGPFASRERYEMFLTVQYRFHCEINALYANPVLEALLPDLGGRPRLNLIEQDLADLGSAPPVVIAPAVFLAGADADIPTALGWLYVAEGSNLGAAFLLKEAAKLGLSESFGARHLAAAPEGRGLHWKTFTASLDGLDLTDSEDNRVIDGARAAFVRVQQLVLAILAV